MVAMHSRPLDAHAYDKYASNDTQRALLHREIHMIVYSASFRNKHSWSLPKWRVLKFMQSKKKKRRGKKKEKKHSVRALYDK